MTAVRGKGDQPARDGARRKLPKPRHRPKLDLPRQSIDRKRIVKLSWTDPETWEDVT